MTSSDAGKQPELAWLPVDKLSVDPAYQRTLESRRSQALIERIAGNFRWSCFQAVLAVKQGKGWVILDGQHRVEAARQRKISHVPAVVVEAVSVAEQAAAFVQANLDRVAVNPFALHHARVVAGDDNALMVDRVCRASGVEIPKYPIPADKLKPGQTLALVTIARLARSGGEQVATMVLKTAAGAYGSEGGGLRASLITALGRVIGEAAAPERRPMSERACSWLKTQAPSALHANALKRTAAYGGTEVSNLHTLITRGAASAPRAAAPGSSIQPPTKAQLMGRR